MKEIVNFFFELGQLKRIKHEGWKLIGVKDPESVAEHSLRAAQIGYILASLEKYKEPEKIATAILFHDIGECRIGDVHKVANRYVVKDEKRAVEDQTRKMGEVGKSVYKAWHDAETIALCQDADLLEQAVTAKEFIEKGYKYAQNWIYNISKKLQTASAKKLLLLIKKTDSNDWWQGLKKI